jgi:hypothetical protein
MQGLRTVFFASLLVYGQASYGAGNVNFTAGVRQLDKNQWAPVDKQPSLGVLTDFSLSDLPLYASIGLQASNKNSGGFDSASIVDLSAGMKVMPLSGAFRPYFGAGVADVYSRWGSIHNSSIGYYIGGGAIYRIGGHFNLGADLRMLRGTKASGAWGAIGDANSYVGSVLMGFGWD